jgi:hypothetical protein
MGQHYEKASQKLSFRKILWNNFIGGLAWAIGATVGLAIIFTFLALIGKSVNLIPIVGSFASQVIDFIMKNNPNFRN